MKNPVSFPLSLLALVIHLAYTQNMARTPDIPPHQADTVKMRPFEGDDSEFEMMRVEKARQLAKKKAERKREQVKELVITEESFFDIQIDNFYGPGEHRTERIIIGCFGLLTPVTCLNFMSLTRGFRKGKEKHHYKGSKIERIIPDFMIQLGNVKAKAGTGHSIFGRVFADENFDVSHDHAGWVGMANYGPDTNGSQFYILLRAARWLDRKYVIFGKVTQGMDFLQALGEEETFDQNYPVRNITIVDSGSFYLKKHIRLSDKQFGTDKDLRPFE